MLMKRILNKAYPVTVYYLKVNTVVVDLVPQAISSVQLEALYNLILSGMKI